MSTAARTTTATPTGLSERFEGRLKELANQHNDVVMNTTGCGQKPYRWDQLWSSATTSRRSCLRPPRPKNLLDVFGSR